MKVSALLILPVFCLLGACSWFGGNAEPPPPTLAELQPVELPAVDRSVPRPKLETIVNQYQSALEVAEEPETRNKIQRRLAGLEMLQSEQRQLNAEDTGHYYQGAIDLYKNLLATHPQHEGNDRLRYQLAKAYELNGQLNEAMVELNQLVQQYPSSEFYPEAQFRRAEILFSRSDYRQAEQAYKAVIGNSDQQAADSASSFYRNALYMHGWSQFKRNRYRASLKSFTEVLDGLLPEDGDLQQLKRSQREIAEDSLRVMGLAFSYLDGAKTIREVYSKLGERSWQHLFYQQLGELYLSKERYRDSADTYKLFVESYPGSDYAPLFSVKMIDVYGKGNFPSLILPAKRQFIKNYGIRSDYWRNKDEQVRDSLRPHLHSYLTELAKYQHALAQTQQKEHNAALKKGKKTKTTVADLQAAFLLAGNWYTEFIETFPQDKATPGMVFLMAESLFEGNALPRAIDAYEQVAYQYRDREKGAEAGYSAILGYDRHIATLEDIERELWQQQKIASSRRFAENYAGDKRAVPVLAKASEQLLALKDYVQAIEIGALITGWQPVPDSALLRTGWLVQGHSQFQLENFVDAETAYGNALALMTGNSNQQARQQTTERLAATVFKRGEQLLAAGSKELAIEQLLRIQQISPDSEIAVKAQYDSAAHLIELGNWQRAEQVLVSFRNRYPKHALTVTIPAKLAHLYQQLKNWQQAGDALLVMVKNSADPDAKRQSLYLAAEMYEKAENWDAAISHYRDYAHGYPQPFDLVTEARYKMSQLYITTNAPDKRRFWLRKLLEGHKQAGADATERSKYLAAFSAEVFADDEYRRFQKIALKLPLKKSLKKKRAAMEKTLSAYNQVLEFGVQEFFTLANFRIGDIYARLSADLMNSERPKLSALELEQYELLLEEQAYPFEEKAIEVLEANARRSWSGIYDEWVKNSFDALSKLLPGRYSKQEQTVEVARDVY